MTTRTRLLAPVLALALGGLLTACGGALSSRVASPPSTSGPTSGPASGPTSSTGVPVPTTLPTDAALLLMPGGDSDSDADDVTQVGTAPVRISWSRIDDGRATGIAGPLGTRGWNMPDFTTSEVYPRAAMVVRNAPGHDGFSPGDEPFSWGADFQLDAESIAHTGPDNGDNLVQRGLWGESAEFKAEADLRRASCAVHGTDGILLVRAHMQAQPGKWYRMRCYRGSDSLTVSVRELGADGWGPDITSTVTGPVGSVEFPEQMPISIGGKIAANGELIRSATDQFNGWIANPVVQIGSPS
ncbi:MAG: hypothetical protein QM747_07350 [Nocardioides sp.]